MKSFNRHHLAMLPLLTILCSSPAVMESKFNNRSIASLAMIVESYPKLEAFRKNQAPESIQKDQDNSLEKFKLKRDALTEKIKKERESFKKDQSDKVIVGDQKKLIHSLATEVLVVEADLKDLQDRTLIESEEEASVKAETESKKVIESLLSDLEANEVLVAKADVPKVEEPKKEEPKNEEPKKEEPKKEICESDEKNKVLTTQVEELLKQQQQILQTMMGMAQMMVSMFQQQQGNPIANSFAYEHSLYRYNQPMTAGNWVYYPNGFQPSQPNIFAPQQQQPQQQQQYQPYIPQGGGMYPDQVNQAPIPKDNQGDWSMRPTEFFPDPRFQTQYMAPGQFGHDPFSFNMGNSFPTVTQR
jgi:hypothetical protein